MQTLIKALLALSILGMTTTGLAEEIWYPGGKKPVLTIKEKVRRSLASAPFVAEGEFAEVAPAGQITPLDATKGTHPVQFRIGRMLRGTAGDTPTIEMRVVAYRPMEGPGVRADATALARGGDIERAAGGKTVAFGQYRDALSNARLPLLFAPTYLRDFFIVPVAVGGLDTPYREADVVVQVGKRYVIFVFRDPVKAGNGPLFPNELDIYDADDPEVKAALADAG